MMKLHAGRTWQVHGAVTVLWREGRESGEGVGGREEIGEASATNMITT